MHDEHVAAAMHDVEGIVQKQYYKVRFESSPEFKSCSVSPAVLNWCLHPNHSLAHVTQSSLDRALSVFTNTPKATPT